MQFDVLILCFFRNVFCRHHVTSSCRFSLLTIWSNSSLLECSSSIQATWVLFPAVSRCSCKGWRWPWSSLSIVVTLTWHVLPDIEHADLQVPNVVSSIFRLEQLAIAFQPTSWCSPYVFMYARITHALGEGRGAISQAQVDVMIRH